MLRLLIKDITVEKPGNQKQLLVHIRRQGSACSDASPRGSLPKRWTPARAWFYFCSRTISSDSSMRTERAPALSRGQSSRNGP